MSIGTLVLPNQWRVNSCLTPIRLLIAQIVTNLLQFNHRIAVPNRGVVLAHMFWVWNMALLRRQEERSVAQLDSWFFHMNLLNAFRDWVYSGLTTVRLYQLHPTERWCYNWRLKDRIASVFSTLHTYVLIYIYIYMIGHVSCFLVSIAATCTVSVCVSLQVLKRLSAGTIQQFQDSATGPAACLHIWISWNTSIHV